MTREETKPQATAGKNEKKSIFSKPNLIVYLCKKNNSMSAIECGFCSSLGKSVSVKGGTFSTDGLTAHAKLHFDQLRAVLPIGSTFDGIYARCFLEHIGRSGSGGYKTISASRKGKSVSFTLATIFEMAH